jgi:hypothetical protein
VDKAARIAAMRKKKALADASQICDVDVQNYALEWEKVLRKELASVVALEVELAQLQATLPRGEPRQPSHLEGCPSTTAVATCYYCFYFLLSLPLLHTTTATTATTTTTAYYYCYYYQDYLELLKMEFEAVDDSLFDEAKYLANKRHFQFHAGPPKQVITIFPWFKNMFSTTTLSQDKRCLEKAALAYQVHALLTYSRGHRPPPCPTHQGDYSRLKDLRRASIVCPSMAAIVLLCQDFRPRTHTHTHTHTLAH